MSAERVDFPAWLDWYAASATPARSQSSSAMGGGYLNSGAFDGNWVEWQQVTVAGTFTLNTIYIKSIIAGKFQMSVDGDDVGALTDGYVAGTTYNNVLSITDIVLTEGVHTIRTTANGKNASSIGYAIFLQWFSLEIQ